jgi:hypothetical protein
MRGLWFETLSQKKTKPQSQLWWWYMPIIPGKGRGRRIMVRGWPGEKAQILSEKYTERGVEVVAPSGTAGKKSKDEITKKLHPVPVMKQCLAD